MFGHSSLINRIVWGCSTSIGLLLALSITVYVNAQNYFKFEQSTKLATSSLLEVKDFTNVIDRLAQNIRANVFFLKKISANL
jgi:hypothetical protein